MQKIRLSHSKPLWPLLFIALAMGAGQSCQKESSATSNNSTGADSTASNFEARSILADNAYDDIFQTAVKSGSDNNIAYANTSSSQQTVAVNAHQGAAQALGVQGCPIYTVTPNDLTTFPKTIVVDFGSGCTDSAGVTRAGQITYVFSNKLITPGTTVSATFSGYKVNQYQLSGTYSITNNSSLSNGIAFATQTTNGNIVFPDATSYSYSGNKTVTQTAGVSTPTNLSDDIYSITGSHNFSGNGASLTNTITTPLTKSYSCKFIQSGIISFVYNSNIKGTLDFGAGTCDGIVTIKIGNFSNQITFQ